MKKMGILETIDDLGNVRFLVWVETVPRTGEIKARFNSREDAQEYINLKKVKELFDDRRCHLYTQHGLVDNILDILYPKQTTVGDLKENEVALWRGQNKSKGINGMMEVRKSEKQTTVGDLGCYEIYDLYVGDKYYASSHSRENAERIARYWNLAEGYPFDEIERLAVLLEKYGGADAIKRKLWVLEEVKRVVVS